MMILLSYEIVIMSFPPPFPPSNISYILLLDHFQVHGFSLIVVI